MLKLRRQKAKPWRTSQRKPYNTMALVFLLVGASWQGIVNAPIERNTWSLPKYAAGSCACECASMQVTEATEAYAFVVKPVKFKISVGTMNLV